MSKGLPRIPHGQQAAPLDDLFTEIFDAYTKCLLRPIRIDHHRNSRGDEYTIVLEASILAQAPAQLQNFWSANSPYGSQVQISPADADAGMKNLGVSKHVITGFRDFDLVSLHDGFVLASRNNAYWRPRKKMVAYCTKRGIAADHDAPGEHCDCGIYAFAKPDHPDLISQNKVWGEVAMWGEVLICESGYRAEYAYPTNLFMRDTGTKGVRYVASELEQAYGVPVFLVPERAGKTAAEIMMEILAENPLSIWEGSWDVSVETELDQDTIDKLLRPDD